MPETRHAFVDLTIDLKIFSLPQTNVEFTGISIPMSV